MSLRKQVDFRRLLVGQGASALGDWMGTFALMALVDYISDSATAVAGVLVFRLLPAALGGPLTARLVGVWDRRRTMITMDLMRAGMIAVVPFVQELWWIYLWAALLEAPSVVFLAARDSAIPDLVDKPDLPLANALMMGSSYGNIPLGGALFAVFASLPLDDGWLGSHPHALVFWIDSVTFGVSALYIARVMGLKSQWSVGSDPSVGEKTGSGDRVRLRDAWAVPLVRKILPATAAAAVGLGALFSLGIKLVQEELSASDTQFGILIALFGVGAGAGLATAHKGRNMDLLTLTRYGTWVMGTLVAVMSLSPNVGVTFLGAVGFGAGATVALTSGISALQSYIEQEVERTLAFAAFHIVIRIGLGIAALTTGAIGDGLNSAGLPGTRAVLLASGLIVFSSAFAVRAVPKEPA